MGGDVVLMMPHDVSFTLNAKVTEKGDIVSDFPLKYLPEPPSPGIRTPKPSPVPEPAPKTPPTKTMPPKSGPVIAPIVIAKPMIVNPFRRFTATYGSGDATISLSSFGGTLRLKKI